MILNGIEVTKGFNINDKEQAFTEMIDNNVNWILAKIMHDKGIQSGDIGFDHEYDINRLEAELAKVIASTIKEVEGEE